LSEKVFEFPDAFEPTFHNKAPVAIWSQNQHMLIDSLTLCDFAFPQLVRPFSSRSDWESSEDISGDLDLARRLLAAVSGLDLDDEHLTRIAERAFTLERMMLARVGRGRKLEESLAPHFKLPCRADGTQIEIDGFRQLMDEYLAARDWDLETGWPTAGALRRIGLDEFLPELEEIYRLTQEIQYTTSGEEV
jgi:aldehyde:ferredoxin oxidoreductase